MGLVKSTAFSRHELVTASKLYGRVIRPYGDKLTAMLGDQNWVAPTLTNSWANAGPAAGYRVRDGVLRLRGTISSGTISSGSTGDAFTVPAAYAPDQQVGFICPAAAGFVRVDLIPTGEVRIVAKGNGASNTGISLDKIAIPLGTSSGPPTTATFPGAWPMAASPIGDGAVANSAAWYYKLFKPTNDGIAALDGDDSGWVNVLGAFSSSWVAYGSGLVAPQWRKRRGVMYLRGWVKSGTAGAIINFGSAFAPMNTTAHLVVMNGSGAVGSSTELGATSVYVANTGIVSINAFQYGGTSAYLSLAGVSWLADAG